MASESVLNDQQFYTTIDAPLRLGAGELKSNNVTFQVSRLAVTITTFSTASDRRIRVTK